MSITVLATPPARTRWERWRSQAAQIMPARVRPAVLGAVRPLLYRGDAVTCPCCGRSFGSFMSHRGAPNVRCPACGSMERHRLLWLYLERSTDLLTAPMRLLHVAPEYGIYRQLRCRSNIEYVTGDLDSPLAARQIDVTDLPWQEPHFDAILCNHVLEHVADDRQAMRELFRVLNPGGWAILMVPVARSLPETAEDPAVTDPAERLRRFGQEDHVRLYGADYGERLRQAGFEVRVDDGLAGLGEATIRRVRVRRSSDLFEDDRIFLCRRPGGS